MKKNKKLFIIVTILILGTWIFNSYNFYDNYFHGPILFDHYISTDDDHITVYYVENIFDNIVSRHYIKPNIKREKKYFSDFKSEFYESTYSWPFRIGKTEVSVDDLLISAGSSVRESLENGPIHIEEICIKPNSEAAFVMNIGSIYMDNNILDKYTFVEQVGKNENEVIFKCLKDVTIDGIDSASQKLIADNYEVYINEKIINEKAFPIKVSKDGEVKVVYKKISEDIAKVYDINLKLLATDKEQNRGYIPVKIESVSPLTYSRKNIKQVVDKLRNQGD